MGKGRRCFGEDRACAFGNVTLVESGQTARNELDSIFTKILRLKEKKKINSL